MCLKASPVSVANSVNTSLDKQVECVDLRISCEGDYRRRKYIAIQLSKRSKQCVVGLCDECCKLLNDPAGEVSRQGFAGC